MFTVGADIIMQLDDVVHSLVTGPRLEEATHRSADDDMHVIPFCI